MSWPVLPQNKQIALDAWGNCVIIDKVISTAGALNLIDQGAHISTAKNRNMAAGGPSGNSFEAMRRAINEKATKQSNPLTRSNVPLDDEVDSMTLPRDVTMSGAHVRLEALLAHLKAAGKKKARFSEQEFSNGMKALGVPLGQHLRLALEAMAQGLIVQPSPAQTEEDHWAQRSSNGTNWARTPYDNRTPVKPGRKIAIDASGGHGRTAREEAAQELDHAIADLEARRKRMYGS